MDFLKNEKLKEFRVLVIKDLMDGRSANKYTNKKFWERNF